MIHKFTQTFFACGLLFTLLSTPIFATESTVSSKVKVNDTDSMIHAINTIFEEDMSDLELVSSKKNTMIFKSNTYTVTMEGVDLSSTGKQKGTITVQKNSNIPDVGFELPASANITTNNETVEKTVEFNVKDTKAPEISCEDTYTIEQGNSFTLEASASDDQDGEVKTTVSGNVDTNTIGTYTVNVSAKDSSGNESTKEVTVNVEENFYQKIADAALAQVGVNQDCTMLVTNSLAAVGINFHGSPASYLSLGTLTDTPVPGDICVYQGHVAIYIGNGQAVHGGWLGYTTVVSTVECTNAFVGYVHVNR